MKIITKTITKYLIAVSLSGSMLTGLSSSSLYAQAKKGPINTPPTIDEIEDQAQPSTNDRFSMMLSGITPGVEIDQIVNITVTSSSPFVKKIEVNQTSNGNAFLCYNLKPGSSGISIITLTITDNGKPAASITRKFKIMFSPHQPMRIPKNEHILQ